MKYGIITENSSINDTIYRCFEYVSETDAKKFVRKLKQQSDDNDLCLHTFRELVLGAFIASYQNNVVAEYKIDNKTPDWVVLDSALQVQCIVELTNFHIDQRTRMNIEAQHKIKRTATYFISSPYERLHYSISNKAQTYKELVEKHNLPYVVAICGSFEADVEIGDLRECLFKEKEGVFVLRPELSGLLYFTSHSGQHHFQYFRNPFAARGYDLPQGSF